jgi:hypothetical protein
VFRVVDPNALAVPASALCTELTGSSSTSALVDVDLESEEQFDPRLEYANEMDPNALDLIGKKVQLAQPFSSGFVVNAYVVCFAHRCGCTSMILQINDAHAYTFPRCI